YVVNGMVDYDRFKRTPEFDTYLQRLAQFDPNTLPESERLAFWINAYNGYTIELINEHNERGSIRDINTTLGFLKLHGPWSEPLAVVGQRRYTLDDIEQRIITRVISAAQMRRLDVSSHGSTRLAQPGSYSTAGISSSSRLLTIGLSIARPMPRAIGSSVK
ncbi:MAG: DUF547 domain-containing protein, partial [Gemmatimonadaceae bacterium]